MYKFCANLNNKELDNTHKNKPFSDQKIKNGSINQQLGLGMGR